VVNEVCAHLLTEARAAAERAAAEAEEARRHSEFENEFGDGEHSGSDTDKNDDDNDDTTTTAGGLTNRSVVSSTAADVGALLIAHDQEAEHNLLKSKFVWLDVVAVYQVQPHAQLGQSCTQS
jgi:hypothetical protein